MNEEMDTNPSNSDKPPIICCCCKNGSKRSVLDHKLVAVLLGALLVLLPTYLMLRQQQLNYIQDKKWTVVTSYPTSLNKISGCPRDLRSVFYKVADKADVNGITTVTQADLDRAFSVLEECNNAVVSAYISLAGVGQSQKPLNCLYTAIASAKDNLSEVPNMLKKPSQFDGRVTTIVGPALKDLSESWTMCLKELNEDILKSAKKILSE